MNITSKHLAKLLYEIVDGKKPVEIENVIKKFVGLLARNGYLKKEDRVISEFIKLWNGKRGIVEAEAISARELGKEIVKLLNDYIVKLSGAKEVMLKEKIAKKILGGVVIKYGDRVVDGSLRTRVEELKNKMVK